MWLPVWWLVRVLIMHLHVCWVRVGNVIAIACALECLWLGRQSVPELSYT